MYTGLKEYFEVMGWEVSTVGDEDLKGAKDKDVVKHAEENNFLLVTQDQKPADLADLQEVPHVYISSREIAELIDSKIREKYPDK